MNHPSNWLAGVEKIAVLRANALGDYIFAQPALYALQSAYPQAEIVLLGKAWHAAFIDGRPGPVKRVVIVPPYRGVSEPDRWAEPNAAQKVAQQRFFETMQHEQFELAMQMHGGGGNSNPFVQQLGARLTAGMRARGAPPLDRWIPYFYWQHEVIRLLEVVALVGATPVMLEPRIEVTARDHHESCQVVPETDRPLVILHPGASDPRRRWPAERFASVADTLAREGYQMVMVGIPEERPIVDRLLASMQQPALDLCGKLSLHGLTGLLQRAALVIANDSGPRHLAEAAGTPTVGIYWCGNLINAGAAFRAKHRPHLSWRIHCPVCGQNTLHDPCTHQESFVDEVRVEEVLESSLDLLQSKEKLGS